MELRSGARRKASSVLTTMFDDDPAKIGMRVMGIQVKGPISAIPDFTEESNITDLILAIPSLTGPERSRILDT